MYVFFSVCFSALFSVLVVEFILWKEKVKRNKILRDSLNADHKTTV